MTRIPSQADLRVRPRKRLEGMEATQMTIGWAIFLLFEALLAALLIWTEMSHVQVQLSLSQLKNSVVTMKDAIFRPELVNQVVHVTGQLRASVDQMQDPDFAITAPSVLQLSRRVEMFQWKKFSRKSSLDKGVNRRTVTYYEKGWFVGHCRSEHYSDGHQNPTPEWECQDFLAPALLGELQLSPKLREQALSWKTFPLKDVPPPAGFQRLGDCFVRGDIQQPKLGDLRISFPTIPSPLEVSIFAKLNPQGELEPWVSPSGTEFGKLELGIHSSQQLLGNLTNAASSDSWTTRLILLVFLGGGFLVHQEDLFRELRRFRPMQTLIDTVGLWLASVLMTAALPLMTWVVAILIGQLWGHLSAAFGVLSKRKGS